MSIKEHHEKMKLYICLLTCTTSRAVHLETVIGLSTITFLLAFRRFFARSLPVVMMSDNATMYTSAADELSTLMKSEEIATPLGLNVTVWRLKA